MDLYTLNPSQKMAVEYIDSPVLVTAGAGSGKTRVITYKIAYLIKEIGFPESGILAVTFTNKAAEEMRTRVKNLLGRDALFATISTFHSLCLRILRKEAVNLGYNADFAVADTQDSLSVIRDILKKNGKSNNKDFSPKKVQALFSRIKNRCLELKADNPFNTSVLAMFDEYNESLKNNNIMDFDDLLIHTEYLFRHFPTIREYYQQRYPCILVDEFQDTNHVQYELIKQLSSDSGLLCVVGDEDQSIYGWRGANYENIIHFTEDFTTTKIIKLEENYRSSKEILDIANTIISKNDNRYEKVLRPNIEEEGKVSVFEGVNPSAEAEYIAREIKVLKNNVNLSDIVILYRANYLSRNIEDALRKHNIPYKIIGGYKFYERKEIKDILSYIRLIHNPHDNVSFKRVINVPGRKIGPVTLDKLEGLNFILFEALKSLPSGFTRKAELDSFRELINSFRKKEFSSDMVAELIEESGYLEMLKSDPNTLEAQSRIENLNEFVSVVDEYLKTSETSSLASFLDTVSLLSDTDEIEELDCINLMTIHCAKGLEYNTVFVIGLEEGTFPSEKTLQSVKELAEERRLMYVAVTRAMRQLILTFSRERGWGWQMTRRKASRFLKEIPETMVHNKRLQSYSVISKMAASASLSGKSDKKKEVALIQDPNGIVKGAHVRHITYGEGTVLNVVDGNKMVVKFKRSGMKVLNGSVLTLMDE